ncbi:hypothetical protein CPB84DRAFT_1813506 [Gymnopilus junonius]|uniref:Uncharacterized protein n=1 Tax=Gymnopilus junonius TaxID=109634 RepID=A0A9P5NT17_GYMJU|nr:hypothetical protein CPB84DRAFT_1813506 [Gymnopilus junonius]
MPDPQFAYYPLTHFDLIQDNAGHSVGWLVEGILDKKKLESALQRLTIKWPMLAGRLERQGRSYRIKVPLGSLEDGYPPFILTSKDSDVPINNFVKLPLPDISDSLPASLFRSTTAPTAPQMWFQQDIPLTYWHLTYFRHPGYEYTGIGLTFSHAVFDGMGIASVIHALEAEIQGRPWPVTPVHLVPGDNENALQTTLDSMEENMGAPGRAEYHYVDIVGVWYALTYVLWYIWQTIWHKAHSRIVMLPVEACEKLVSDTRQAIALQGKEDVRLSTGDVLAAWLLKTVYSADSNSGRRVSLVNQMSLRNVFKLRNYSHNCFIPLPYPIFTIAELQNISINDLARRLSIAKVSASVEHAMIAYNRLRNFSNLSDRDAKCAILPIDIRADETLTMTNMMNGHIANIDWTGLGGGKTIFRYKSNLTSFSFLFSNLITIVGRLDDGRIALEVILNKRRMKALEDEIRKLSIDVR